MQKIIHTVLAGTLALGAALAGAQEFPSKTAFFIVPFAAGGPADITARKILPMLQTSMKQTVVVDNVPGGSGSIAVGKLLNAPADGHTFLIGTVGDTALAPMAIAGVKYQGESVRLVSPLSQNAFVLLAKTSLPANNADELVAYARNPANKELFYGTTGAGSTFHLVAEDFAGQAGFKWTQVAYRGLAPVVQDVMAGQIDVAFYPLGGNVFDLIKSGKVKALAVTGSVRHPKLNDVPTLNEGKYVKNFNHSIWPGVFVPATTPEPVVAKLHGFFSEIVKSAEFKRFCEETGTTPFDPPLSLAEASSFYKADIERYRKVARAIHLAPQ